MTAIDGFFRHQVEAEPDPRVRDWKRRLEAPGASATLSLVEPKDVYDPFGPAMFVQFNDGHPIEELRWDDDRNSGLIRLGVRADDPGQEALRMALTLKAALRKMTREVGDGYFNALLMDFIRERGLDGERRIADVVSEIHVNKPHQGRTYRENLERIAEELMRRAEELRGPLKYPEVEAKRILVEAIALFVDRRFGVSDRRKLGWL